MNSKKITFGFFLVASLIGCGESTIDEAATPTIRPAKIVTIETASVGRNFTFPAVIRASQTAELTFQTAGQVIELNVLQAKEITKGDVIAKLDQRNASNAVNQARAEYNNAEAEYQRAERLVERDAISRSTLDQRRTQRDVAKVSLANAQKALSDTILTAPFNGVISRVYIEQFQNIQAKEPIAVIQSDGVEAVINMPGSIIAQAPRLKPQGTFVTLDAAPEVRIPALFREAAGLADQNTQTFEVTFDFDPPEDLLILPGMTATLSTTLDVGNLENFGFNGIAAPLTSILAEGDEKFVWVFNDVDQTIQKTKVETGDGAGEMIVVTKGLEPGQQIVAAGVSFLHDGMRVRPWSPE
ncbi:MAG: efflux RND transporter periplasmic adaptor subunit [Pseudomonadota bacterium]